MPFVLADVVAKAADAAFGRPLVTNVLRAQLVEAMIALVLEPAWHWCGADYAPCDFEREDGLRPEVKQSAARQSWNTDKPSKAIFDVAARTGRNEANGWVEKYGRAAHLYVFAHHPLFDDTADHRDPAQWQFYVVPTADLPEIYPQRSPPVQQRIALSTIRTMTSFVPIYELAETVGAIANISSDRRTA